MYKGDDMCFEEQIELMENERIALHDKCNKGELSYVEYMKALMELDKKEDQLILKESTILNDKLRMVLDKI
jgi:hypothetical protein